MLFEAHYIHESAVNVSKQRNDSYEIKMKNRNDRIIRTLGKKMFYAIFMSLQLATFHGNLKLNTFVEKINTDEQILKIN